MIKIHAGPNNQNERKWKKQHERKWNAQNTKMKQKKAQKAKMQAHERPKSQKWRIKRPGNEGPKIMRKIMEAFFSICNVWLKSKLKSKLIWLSSWERPVICSTRVDLDGACGIPMWKKIIAFACRFLTFMVSKTTCLICQFFYKFRFGYKP